MAENKTSFSQSTSANSQHDLGEKKDEGLNQISKIAKHHFLDKMTTKSHFLSKVKKNKVSFKSLIPFAFSTSHFFTDFKNAVKLSAVSYRNFELSEHNFTRVIKNELALSNFLFHNFFKAKQKTDSCYWSMVGFGANIVRVVIRHPVQVIDMAANHYTDFKLNLIRNRKFGALFILLYWIASRPLIKPFFLGAINFIKLISFVHFFKFFRYLIRGLARDNRLQKTVTGTQLRNSFYKLVNFSLFSVYKLPLLREKALTSKERLLNILRRPNSRILAFFTPTKTLFIVILIMTLFTILYTTIII